MEIIVKDDITSTSHRSNYVLADSPGQIKRSGKKYKKKIHHQFHYDGIYCFNPVYYFNFVKN